MTYDNAFPTRSLYTAEVRQFITSRPWPKTLKYEIVEYPAYLVLRFFVHNFVTLSPDEQQTIPPIVKEVMEKVRASGIPITFDRVE